MTELAKLIYCSWEGTPAVYVEGSGGVAFTYYNGAWHEANGADIFTKATAVSKATFESMFGKLPPIEDVLPCAG